VPEAVGDAEELIGAAPDGRGHGDQGEPWQALGGLDAVGGDGDQNTKGPAHDGQAGRGNPTSRPASTYASTQAGTAIRWPQATPPRIPSRDRRKTR
jgi:hypothetical protein